MKVKDLIIELQEMNPEHEVIMASDSEGNNFGPFSGFGIGQYVPDSTWSGEVRGEEDGYDDYKENAIIFYPVN